MTELVAFKDFNEATANAVPTIVAYDAGTSAYIIGDKAKALVMSGRSAAQDFKRYIGDPDPAFEGKPSTKTARPETRWFLRPDLASASSVSTKEVARIFLETLFRTIGRVPKQLVIGIPTIGDDEWQNNYRKHIRQLMGELEHGEPYFFPEPFAVFQYYRHVENLIPATDHSLTVLILDYGGGTLNCCLVETTREGNLARGGATAAPSELSPLLALVKKLTLDFLSLPSQKSKTRFFGKSFQNLGSQSYLGLCLLPRR